MYLIYKTALGYDLTTLENYNAFIVDCNKITHMMDFHSATECKEYLMRLYNMTDDQFVIKE